MPVYGERFKMCCNGSIRCEKAAIVRNGHSTTLNLPLDGDGWLDSRSDCLRFREGALSTYSIREWACFKNVMDVSELR